MKHISALCLALLLSAFTAFSQDITLPELAGFKKTTDYPVFTADNLWDFINGAADTYLSYGFEDLHVAEYSKGKNVIKLEIYRHKDDIQAFGIYSSERSPGFRFINIGAQGYKTDGSLNYFKGRYYVKIRTYSKSEKVIQTLETLALRVSDMLQGGSEMPSGLKEFPDMGKKKNEETYIKESVLGHDFLTGAFKALYEAGGNEFSIFLFKKQSVAEASKTVAAYLKLAGLEIDDPSGGKYTFRDGYNGDIFLSWKGNTIVIISGLTRDRIDVAERYSTEILR
ncbi:MAG: hypothetical protein C0408_06055 [Odoribacter sp.]|nr:hypothetical protein [Odoribacter sp.]